MTASLGGEGAKVLADMFDMPSVVGRIAKRSMKKVLKLQQKQQYSVAVNKLEDHFERWLEKVRSFLATISVRRKSFREANSQKLISQLMKCKGSVRLETKLRKALGALEQIATKQLIYNTEIELTRQVLIVPGDRYEAREHLEAILKKPKGYIKIFDPYVNSVTLTYLHQVPTDIPIKLLTINLGKAAEKRRFLRLCNEFADNHPKFEVKQIKQKVFHDRFIITRDEGWSIGASIRDFGKSGSILSPLDREVHIKLEALFDEQWNLARALQSTTQRGTRSTQKPVAKLVREILDGISTRPILDTLLKTINVALKLNRAEELVWLEQELHGYRVLKTELVDIDDVDVPSYRRIKGKFYVRINGRLEEYPWPVFFNEPAPVLESYIKDGEKIGATRFVVHIPMPENVPDILKKAFGEELPTYFELADLRRALLRLRLRITDLLHQIVKEEA